MPDSVKRPILRWHGGKWLLARWIISNFPEHRAYVEPFGGAASVLLRKPRCYAEVYNDLDGEVVNLFKVMRDHGDALKQLLLLTPYARDEFQASYTPSSGSAIEQARRTVVRSYMGYGADGALGRTTGFRANTTRKGSIPAHDWKTYPECLDALIARLRGCVIENRDARLVMTAHDGPDTLHYVDPPYVAETRGHSNGVAKHGYRHEMTETDHVDLAAFLSALKGAVVLSGYPSPLYETLYAGWTRVERPALADGARPRIEVLWKKP